MKTQMLCIETTKVWDLIIIICKALCPQAGAVLNSCLHETKEKVQGSINTKHEAIYDSEGTSGQQW